MHLFLFWKITFFDDTNRERVNYENENINISLPIFAIHGNHDEPKGDGGYGALDLLAISNYINYFGKHKSVDEITIFPVLLNKAGVKIALYGIGAIRDERLHRLFQQKKVKIHRKIQIIFTS